MIALVEIAIVLCSVFLVAIPAIAAEQTMQKVSANTVTTASEDDYVLGIYGNANEDDTIDMRDLTYVKLIFFGKKPETALADAKYDGKINPLDFIQIKLIIVGKENELTIVDLADRIVTVKKPVERIVVLVASDGIAIQILKATDRVVGRSDHSSLPESNCFPELSKVPSVGSSDYEAILSLNPDLVITYALSGTYKRYTEKLPGIPVVAFDCFAFETMREEFETLGYILDKEDEAKEYIDFSESHVDMMKERTKGLSEDEKPRVFIACGSWRKPYMTANRKDTILHPMLEINSGVRNIAANVGIEETHLGGWLFHGAMPIVDPEWVIKQNPDIIVTYSRWGRCSYRRDTDDLSLLMKEVEYFKSRPELAMVKAVKSDKIYVVNGDIIPGVGGGVIGGTYLAKLFHPELFEDLDPRAIHQEYVDFRGMDFDVYEHGVFVYPPLES
jgi:iron complex transport system substrate-binding protein